MRSYNWNPLVYSASLSLHNSTAAVNNTTFNALKQFLKNPSLSEKRIVTIPRDGVIVQTEVTREAAPPCWLALETIEVVFFWFTYKGVS